MSQWKEPLHGGVHPTITEVSCPYCAHNTRFVFVRIGMVWVGGLCAECRSSLNVRHA